MQDATRTPRPTTTAAREATSSGSALPCVCGKPAAHRDAPTDSPAWACHAAGGGQINPLRSAADVGTGGSHLPLCASAPAGSSRYSYRDGDDLVAVRPDWISDEAWQDVLAKMDAEFHRLTGQVCR